MRGQLVKTIESVMAVDKRLVLLLGDIGVYGFRNAMARYPDRAFNIGILEQATVSVAAGLASEGLVPVFHSIAPFVVERGFEQLKIDFGYQELPGVIISVGASYDYAALGCTHQCAGDVSILKTVPGMRIVVPGAADEFDSLFRQAYGDGHPIYFRLSERSHSLGIRPKFGEAVLVQEGHSGTVVAVGPMLGPVLEACADLDISVLYYTTLEPFDVAALRACAKTDRIAVVEPFYEGTLSHDVLSAFAGKRSVRVLSVGVPRKFRHSYGTTAQQDTACGLSVPALKQRLNEFFRAA